MKTTSQHKIEFKFTYGSINETTRQLHNFHESEEGLLADVIRQYMYFLVSIGFQPESIEGVMEEIVQEKSWSNKNE